MAVYKVIQDIESEDKLLGPLSLKGFIYALIAGTLGFINFKLLLAQSPLKWLFLILFGMPMILFGVLASPLGREQPTEVWLLSRIRFFLKPRKRIWDQEGVNDLVTITVPKKTELQLTKDLSPNEVQSRLKTLATTLDTRGWAIKNVDVNLNTPELEAQNQMPESDRLVGSAGVPQQMPVVDVHAADDILDEKNNPTAQKFESMMKKADADRKKGLLSHIKELVDSDDEEPVKSTKDLPSTKVALIKATRRRMASRKEREAAEKEELERKLRQAAADFTKSRKKPNVKHHALNAPPPEPARTEAPKPSGDTVTAGRQAVNMELAQSGSAFSVATLEQLANRSPKVEQTGPDEVTISLH